MNPRWTCIGVITSNTSSSAGKCCRIRYCALHRSRVANSTTVSRNSLIGGPVLGKCSNILGCLTCAPNALIWSNIYRLCGDGSPVSRRLQLTPLRRHPRGHSSGQRFVKHPSKMASSNISLQEFGGATFWLFGFIWGYVAESTCHELHWGCKCVTGLDLPNTYDRTLWIM